MRKKSARKKTAVTEMIHFRPGEELGTLIDVIATQEAISRGETAKRLAALAVRGFDLGFYGFAKELVEHNYNAISFDQACHELHVAVLQDCSRGPSTEVVELPRDEKKQSVQKLIDNYRMLRGIQEDAERTTVEVHVYLDR